MRATRRLFAIAVMVGICASVMLALPGLALATDQANPLRPNDPYCWALDMGHNYVGSTLIPDFDPGYGRQCVEYVKRFYYYGMGYTGNDGTVMDSHAWSGDASQYYGRAASDKLNAYPNNGTTAPAPGDILCLGGGYWDSDAGIPAGHVAIVIAVTSTSVTVLQQNDLQKASVHTFAMVHSGSTYSVSVWSGYTCQGWLRRRLHPASLSVVGKVSLSTGPYLLGNTISGSFTVKNTGDVSGTWAPLVLALRGPSGEHRDAPAAGYLYLAPGKSATVHFSRPLDLAGKWTGFVSGCFGGKTWQSPPGGTVAFSVVGTPTPTASFLVYGHHSFWTDTGLIVPRGSTIDFSASGSITWDPTVSEPTVGPQGASWTPSGVGAPWEFLLPNDPIAGLIGKIGSDTFFIGATRRVTSATGGSLQLGLNERWKQGCWDDNSGSFTVDVRVSAPTLTAVSPSSGPVGTTVSLTGTNFTNATAVSFNGHAASFTVRSDTKIITRVPSGATSGTIRVTTPGGSATSTARFTVIIKPVLTLKLSGLTRGILKLGKTLAVSGNVTPKNLAGKLTLTVQYKRGNTWVKATSWLRALTMIGTYSITYKPSKRASYRIQAMIAKTATHTAATTAWLAFTVK
jgi:hypothetical protein